MSKVHVSPFESKLNSDYPEVQLAVDRLYARDRDNIRRTEGGEHILTPELVNEWAGDEGIGNGKRGTFYNKDVFVYVKPGHQVDQEIDVDRTLELARELTARGAIHPDSKWGVYDNGTTYQLFVVSPRLEAWSLDSAVSGEYDDRPGPKSDRSHLAEWFKQIDPSFVVGQTVPEDSLLHHLNPTEASHDDNWGWDRSGKAYPIDVEVVNLGNFSLLRSGSSIPGLLS